MQEELRKTSEAIPGQEKVPLQNKSAKWGQVPSHLPQLVTQARGAGYWNLSNQEAGEAGGRGDVRLCVVFLFFSPTAQMVPVLDRFTGLVTLTYLLSPCELHWSLESLGGT